MTNRIVTDEELRAIEYALHLTDRSTDAHNAAKAALRAVQQREPPAAFAVISESESGCLVFGRTAMVRPVSRTVRDDETTLYVLPKLL